MNEKRSSINGIRTAKGFFVWVLVLASMAAIALGGGGAPGPGQAGVKEAVAGETIVSELTEAAADVVEETAGGDADSAPEVESVVAPVTESAVSDAASSTETEPVTPGGKIQTIAFTKDTRIQQALLFLQDRYQKNIVPSAKVDGTINVTRLRDVTFEQALDAILGRDFAIETEGNIIKVYTAEEYKKIMEDEGRKVYEVITLYYITAEEVGKLVKPVLSATGVIQGTTPAEKQISGGGGGGSAAGGGAGGGSVSGGGGGDKMALHDTIVVFDYPENIEKAKDVIKSRGCQAQTGTR